MTQRYIIAGGRMLLALLLLSSCDPVEIKLVPGTITGTLRDAANGTVLAGVSISTQPITEEEITMSDGSFTITTYGLVGDDTFRVLAEKSGYLTNEVMVTVGPGQTRTASIQLQPGVMLNVNETMLDFGINRNSWGIVVSNNGNTGSFQWSVVEPNENWISVDPKVGQISNNGTATFLVDVDRSVLNPGIYMTSLSVTTMPNVGIEVIQISLRIQ